MVEAPRFGKMTPEEARIRIELACSDYIREPNLEAMQFVLGNQDRYSLLEFVELLQPHITNKEEDVRLNAVSLLVDVSLKLTLKDTEVVMIVEFLCGRLSDKYNIVPKVLSGLSGFIKQRELESGVACKIASDLFNTVDVQALHQDTRFKAYTLINTLLHHNLLGLLEVMKTEFVVNYINFIDGEQDPRNLLIIFNMNVIILQHFNIDTIEELLFDVISCYYPIDFTPPEDSTVHVTPTELKHKLNNCFKASNKLAKFAIPFLIEKCNSSLLQARIQSCDTLKLCILSYGTSCSVEHLTLIWNTMKCEVFGGVNRELRDRCLEVVSALFWVLTLPNVKTKSLDPTRFIKVVLEYCQEKLSYSQYKYMRPTGLVLLYIVKSSGTGSELVAEHCLSWITEKFRSCSDNDVKYVMLDELVTILTEIGATLFRSTEIVNFINWADLQEVFLSTITSSETSDLCKAGLVGLSELLSIYNQTEQHMTTSPPLEMEHIVMCVYHHLSTTTDNEEGLQMLTEISRYHPDLVNKLLLDKLLLKVDEGDPSSRKMLSRLLVGSLLINHSPRLIKLFIEKGDQEVIGMFTVALSYQESEEVIQFCRQFLFHQILNYLIQQAINSQDIEKAVLLFQEFTVALYKGRHPRVVDMTEFTELFTKSSVFKPFSVHSPTHQTSLTAIYAAVLTYGSLDSTFDPVMTPLDLSPLLDLVRVSPDPVTVRSVASVLGLLLNRLDSGSYLEDLKERVLRTVDQCDLINNKVWLCIRACQGLVYRWDSGAEGAVRRLVGCLVDEQTHLHTTHLIGHVLEPVYQGTRMVLYKQRFLLTLVPLITPYLDKTTPISREVLSSVVRGVGSLLLSLPPSLISTHGEALYPIILNNLTPQHADYPALKLVQYLLENACGVITLHLDTLVTQLCECSVGAGVKVKCRVEAVRTLQLCTTQLHHKHTHLQRDTVIKGLRLALTDRKRVVRQAAAQTLQSWILLQP